MYALRIAVMIALSLAFLLATACCGLFFVRGGGLGVLIAGLLFLLVFLVLAREVKRSLLRGDS